MKLNKGFKQFLVKTGIFIGLFILIQLITINLTSQTRLPSVLNPFYLVDLVKAGLVVGVLFLIKCKEEIFKLKKYKTEFKSLFIFGFLGFLFLVAYFLFKSFILDNLNLIDTSLILFIFLRYFIVLLILVFFALAIFGFKFIKDFIKKFKKEILIFVCLVVIVYFLIIEIQKLWYIFSFIIAKAVFFLLNLTSNATLNLADKLPVIGINQFIVGIDKPCSGIESMFLFSFLYLFAICFDWKILNKKKAIGLFIPGVISVFVLSILRIYLLILVGAYISKDFAMGLFHTNIAGVLFIIYFAIFWLLFYNWMKKPEFKSKKKRLIKRIYAKIMNDSLYKNSIYLMISTGIMSVLGFFFWMIGTRLFTPNQVGLAITILSIMALITSFSLLGLNTGLIRYLPKAKDKNKKINTCFTFVALVTIIISVIFLLGLETFSSKLLFIKKNVIFSFIFIWFMIVSSFSALIDSIFIALRSTKFILIKNTIFGFLKIFLLFAFVWLGAYGIFTSWMISLMIAVVFSFAILVYKFEYKLRFVFHDKIIRKIGKYSFGNYVAGFIGGLPIMILPLLILSKLDAEQVAYYYIAMMITTLLFTVSRATTQSLFAEGSYNGGQMKSQIKRAGKIIALLLIPGIFLILFFGEYILLAFGKNYSIQGFKFLQLLALSGVFIGVNSIFETLLRVKKKIKSLIFISIFTTILILGGSYLLINKGLIGIGYAWGVGNMIVSGVYLLFFRK